MKQAVTALIALGLPLSACGGNDPVADKGTLVPADIAGDASASGLAAPANAAAAEAHAEGAKPLVANGQRWVDRSRGGRSDYRYGYADGAPLLVLACEAGGASGLTVVRTAAAPPNAMATMSFTGGGHVASLPMRDIDAGDHARLWSGTANRDAALAIFRTFESGGPVEVSLGVTPTLVLPPVAPVQEMLRRCAGA